MRGAAAVDVVCKIGRNQSGRSGSGSPREVRGEAGVQDHVVVTGAAGFIGSHLCDRLLADGRRVVGVGSFEDYYARELKEANLAHARAHASFTLLEEDLLEADLPAVLQGAAQVYHLADLAPASPHPGAHACRNKE